MLLIKNSFLIAISNHTNRVEKRFGKTHVLGDVHQGRMDSWYLEKVRQ